MSEFAEHLGLATILPVTLADVAKRPDHQMVVKTRRTGLMLSLSVQPRWVKIIPEEQTYGYLANFIQASFTTDGKYIELAVYTKNKDGSYYDKDFQAGPLTRAMVGYMLEHNSGVKGIHFEWNEGADTYDQYMKNKNPFDVWTGKIAQEFGFSKVSGVGMEIDDETDKPKVTGYFVK